MLRTSGNILILNLAITDGLMMVEIPFFLYNTFREGPALGEKGSYTWNTQILMVILIVLYTIKSLVLSG